MESGFRAVDFADGKMWMLRGSIKGEWDPMQFFSRQQSHDLFARTIEKIAATSETASSRERANAAGAAAVPFSPGPLCQQELVLSSETLAAVSRAEIAIARFDTSLNGSCLLDSLRQGLARIEGVSTIRTMGVKPSYRMCCILEFASWECGGVAAFSPAAAGMANTLAKCPPDVLEATIAAAQIKDCVIDILDGSFGEGPVSTSDLLDINRRITFGTPWEAEAGLRAVDYRTLKEVRQSAVDLDLYVPTPPKRLPQLLNDLVSFCNSDRHSVVVRSALAHFQMEAIKAFEAESDQTGRLLAVLIWRKQGLIRNVMPPFSITPAMATNRHVMKLEPYLATNTFRTEKAMLAMDEWVFHSVRACELAESVSRFCCAELARVYNNWLTRLEGAGKHATKNLRQAMLALLGMPVVSVGMVSSVTGCSFSTASSMVAVLEQAGILRRVKSGERNKVYEAKDAVDLFTKVERAFFPAVPLSRDEALKRYVQNPYDGFPKAERPNGLCF